MDPQEFANRVVLVFANLTDLSKAVNDDPSLLGSLSIEDYQLFQNLVKELVWYKGV